MNASCYEPMTSADAMPASYDNRRPTVFTYTHTTLNLAEDLLQLLDYFAIYTFSTYSLPASLASDVLHGLLHGLTPVIRPYDRCQPIRRACIHYNRSRWLIVDHYEYTHTTRRMHASHSSPLASTSATTFGFGFFFRELRFFLALFCPCEPVPRASSAAASRLDRREGCFRVESVRAGGRAG